MWLVCISHFTFVCIAPAHKRDTVIFISYLSHTGLLRSRPHSHTQILSPGCYTWRHSDTVTSRTRQYLCMRLIDWCQIQRSHKNKHSTCICGARLFLTTYKRSTCNRRFCFRYCRCYLRYTAILFCKMDSHTSWRTARSDTCPRIHMDCSGTGRAGLFCGTNAIVLNSIEN